MKRVNCLFPIDFTHHKERVPIKLQVLLLFPTSF